MLLPLNLRPIHAFPWLEWPSLGRDAADHITSLPGRPLGTDLGKQRPQHLLACCSGSFILPFTASIIQKRLVMDYLSDDVVTGPSHVGSIPASSYTLHLIFCMYIIFYIRLLIKSRAPVHRGSIGYHLDISYNS